MAKRGGFPGGMPGNMNNLMKQAQRMQRQMEEKSKEMGRKRVGSNGRRWSCYCKSFRQKGNFVCKIG